MQYKLIAASALVASAFAAPEKRQYQPADASQTEDVMSVLSVLETALPSTLIQEAMTNSAGVASEISSEFAAGETPSWFAALPTDIQTYLMPTPLNATANATGIASSTAPYVSAYPTNSINGTTNSTTLLTSSSSSSLGLITSSASTSASSSSAAGSTSASSARTTTSSGGAAMPTAIMGMGLAGVAGLVGILAL